MTAFTAGKQGAVNHLKIGAADISNFRLRIIGTFAELATVANGGYAVNGNGGKDIRPYSDSVAAGVQPSTALSYKLIQYVEATGFLHMLVFLTATHSTDAVISLYCGDAALNTDGSTALSSSIYKSAYEPSDGSSIVTADLSAGANALTNVSATAVTGPYASGARGGGVSTNGSTTKMTIPNGAFVTTGNTMDFSHWTKRGTSTALGGLLSHRQSGNGFLSTFTAAGTFSVVKGGVVQLDYTSAPQNTNWHKWDVQMDGSGMRIYLDGATTPVATNANTNNLASDTNPGTLGEDNGDIVWFNGSHAGIYQLVTIRTPDQINAEYLNDSDPDTFVTFSAITPFSGGGGGAPLNRLNSLLNIGQQGVSVGRTIGMNQQGVRVAERTVHQGREFTRRNRIFVPSGFERAA